MISGRYSWESLINIIIVSYQIKLALYFHIIKDGNNDNQYQLLCVRSHNHEIFSTIVKCR